MTEKRIGKRSATGEKSAQNGPFVQVSCTITDAQTGRNEQKTESRNRRLTFLCSQNEKNGRFAIRAKVPVNRRQKHINMQERDGFHGDKHNYAQNQNGSEGDFKPSKPWEKAVLSHRKDSSFSWKG